VQLGVHRAGLSSIKHYRYHYMLTAFENHRFETGVHRHLRIAAFYRRVGNEPGYRHHVQVAAGPEFANTSFAPAAQEALAAIRTAEAAPVGAKP
jgi:hypothetical protein